MVVNRKRMIIISALIVILLGTYPSYSLNVDVKEKWFPNGIGNFHDMQYGFGRIWVSQLYDQAIGDGVGRIISINPLDMNDYTVLDISGGVYSIAVDTVHNCIWATGGSYGLAKISPDLSTVEYFPPPSGYNTGLQVTWDGKYVWTGGNGYGIARFYPETGEWVKVDLTRYDGKKIPLFRDLVYDYVRNCIWAFSWSSVYKVDRESAKQLGCWQVPINGEEIFSATFNGEYLFCGNGPNPKPAEVVRINPNDPTAQVIWRLQDYFSFGELYWVHTLIPDANGIVYAGLYRSGYIIIIDPETGPFEYLALNRWHCHGLAFDPYGWLWCCFNENPGKVYKFNIGGQAPPPPPPPKEAVITGYLRFENGTAIFNALVEVGSYSTHTDANGFYEITVPVGDYTVRVTLPERSFSEKDYNINMTLSEES
jgi:streptogramin lyase